MTASIPDNSQKGFTLAELLVALAILGVIATFTIPKILSASDNSKYKAIAKESAAIVAAAYSTYQQAHTPTAATGLNDFLPYINYVAQDTTVTVDTINGKFAGTVSCSDTVNNSCYRLHNGAMLVVNTGSFFGGENTTNGIPIAVDPDGQASAIKTVGFWLYFNGRITTVGTMGTSTTYNSGSPGGYVLNYDSTYDPDWFSWN